MLYRQTVQPDNSGLTQMAKHWWQREFRPGWLPSLLVLGLFPTLVALGFWQLDRAEQKQQLNALYELRQQAYPVSLTALKSADEMAYRRVYIEGQFDPDHSVLIDNRTRDGRAGVEWVQPFYDHLSGQWVLLNRGWQAWPDRRIAPELDTPDATIRLYAWVYVPLGEPFSLSPEQKLTHWPRLLTQLQPEQIWQQLAREGFAYELRIEPGPLALQAEWPVVATSATKHEGYAVQWFAMASALLLLFIYLGLHNGRENNNEQSAEHRP